MTSPKQLQVVNDLSLEELKEIQQKAELLYKHSKLGFSSPTEIMMALLAGRDIGIPLYQLSSTFCFINGKFSTFGQNAIALVQRAGYDVDFLECTAEKAVCKISKDKKSRTWGVTMKTAKERKWHLTREGKELDAWKKYPENMLSFKAFAFCARFFCPGALNGMHIKEELEGAFTVSEEVRKNAIDIEEIVNEEVTEEVKGNCDFAQVKDLLKNAEKKEELNDISKMVKEKKYNLTPEEQKEFSDLYIKKYGELRNKKKNEAQEKAEEVTEGIEDSLTDKDETINVFMDGDKFCATRRDFINLQESLAGFGDTEKEAIEHLKEGEQIATETNTPVNTKLTPKEMKAFKKRAEEDPSILDV